MKKIQERLLQIVDNYEGGNASVFAKKAGIPQSTLHKYLNGRMPSGENLTRMANSYGVNLNWLLTGEGEMTRDKRAGNGNSSITQTGNNGISVSNTGHNSVVQTGGGMGNQAAKEQALNPDLVAAKGMRLLMTIIASENPTIINIALNQLEMLAREAQQVRRK